MRGYLLKRMRQENGQAAVETAIVTPLMVGFVLGTIQLTLMQQASLMLEYAAFNAARSGAVWNMDKDKMIAAAQISLLPTFKPTPDIGSLIKVAAEVYVKQFILTKLGMPLVDVEVLSPKKADFNGQKEIEFDSGDRKNTQMTVRVVYLFELRIPFANFLIWESYWAGQVGQDLRGTDPSVAFIDHTKLWASRVQQGDFSKSCPYTGLNNKKMETLRVAAIAGYYYLPLVTTYTIRMQSNPFLNKPGSTKDEWAGKDKPDCS